MEPKPSPSRGHRSWPPVTTTSTLSLRDSLQGGREGWLGRAAGQGREGAQPRGPSAGMMGGEGGHPLSPGRVEEAQDGRRRAGKAGTEEQQGPWGSGRELVSRHLAQSKCPTHTRPFPPALGPGSMAEGPREDVEARRESRGARRRAVGTEVVTARTGVTLLPLQPHTSWLGEGTLGPGRPGFKSRFSQPQLCVLGDLLCLSIPYFLLYQMGVKVPTSSARCEMTGNNLHGAWHCA